MKQPMPKGDAATSSVITRLLGFHAADMERDIFPQNMAWATVMVGCEKSVGARSQWVPAGGEGAAMAIHVNLG